MDRDKFEEFKTRFYQLEGWDPSSGWPKRSTLEELDLVFVADELEANDKLCKVNNTISGTISGAVQEGVTVIIYVVDCGADQPYATATTDAQGYYTIGNLENGRYLVNPVYLGYSFSSFKWVDIPQAVVQPYDFTATTSVSCGQ